MEYIVLGVQSWEIEDENTRKKIDGISVHYLDPASPSNSEDSIGIFPAKLTADKKLLNKFTTLPGKYRFDIGLKRTGGGKTGVELKDVECLGSVSFDAPHASERDASSNGSTKLYQNEAAKAAAGNLNNLKPKVNS